MTVFYLITLEPYFVYTIDNITNKTEPSIIKIIGKWWHPSLCLVIYWLEKGYYSSELFSKRYLERYYGFPGHVLSERVFLDHGRDYFEIFQCDYGREEKLDEYYWNHIYGKYSVNETYVVTVDYCFIRELYPAWTQRKSRICISIHPYMRFGDEKVITIDIVSDLKRENNKLYFDDEQPLIGIIMETRIERKKEYYHHILDTNILKEIGLNKIKDLSKFRNLEVFIDFIYHSDKKYVKRIW